MEMTRLESAPVHGSGHMAARHSRELEARPPEPDITARPPVAVPFLSRFFDEPMELRGSSFSSWDDSSDFYWKKKSTKEADTILKTTGYSDRYADRAAGL